MIDRIHSAWRAWIDFTSEREHPRVMAAFRIAVGLLALGTLLYAVIGDVVGTLWIDRAYGGAVQLGRGPWLIAAFGGPKPSVVWGFIIVGCAASILVALGAGGRLPCFVAAHAYFALARLNGNTTGGYDLLFTNAFFFLLVAGANRTMSVDCRLRTGKWKSDETIAAWPRRLMILQLLVMYGATGLQKMSPVWTPLGGYTALYWVLQDPNWRRFDLPWLGDFMPLVRAFTALTWHWELGAPFLFLWYYADRTKAKGGRFRRIVTKIDWRKPFAIIGVGLHLGILIGLNVGPFSLISLAYYFAFFTPEELANVRRRAHS
ncbi:MAG: HTTM domain-containing protein [Polyangiaceae bacterium]|nr:HTTM domain-containing protein [Polyangiaceae bacterium]